MPAAIREDQIQIVVEENVGETEPIISIAKALIEYLRLNGIPVRPTNASPEYTVLPTNTEVHFNDVISEFLSRNGDHHIRNTTFEEIQSGPYTGLVQAKIGADLVGVCVWGNNLSAVAVDMNYRRMGIATHLIGMSGLTEATVANTNEAGMALFQSIGWEVVGTETFHDRDISIFLKPGAKRYVPPESIVDRAELVSLPHLIAHGGNQDWVWVINGICYQWNDNLGVWKALDGPYAERFYSWDNNEDAYRLV